MTSKEALDKLYTARDENLLYDQCGIIFSIDLFNIVKKDLERLEALEKENEKLSIEIDDLLDDKIELVVKNKQQDMLIGKLIQENEKLKQAIDIIKDKFKFELGVSVVKEKYCYSLEFLFNNQYFSITKEEYELLKEVIK